MYFSDDLKFSLFDNLTKVVHVDTNIIRLESSFGQCNIMSELQNCKTMLILKYCVDPTVQTLLRL